ncbi:phosphatidylglycerophosphatase B [Pantoea agglomerans]|uniref:undecaprenyl-diphosphate phosphatase n=1 Tax=[Curtobacterium] plantarum TaxID=221276 RepID=A0ABT9T6I7_9GAMM|nr:MULTISPECIES: phosphatidylglycerophosphatase B [Pantoea]KAF6639114.1 phosphatidylglycerophosphatase B [Pantoea sp. EKM10T]KPA08141.1 Phosphatidylglycerophosphatase B [Pantoea agglomerans]MBA8868163.1 phosphatidylglycerophosphatase B [Pantoea agglomerans]MBA8873164.1 phosphatidylglycerophosphatase B [Pantoea agglomerans]MBD8116116.1 phosphatidylglycerophosphatase B [Pantoea agglomerans]
MFKISRRTTFGMLLLLIMPVAVWLSGWRWQPGESNALLKGLFWMTETVTNPWGIVTSVVLSAWMLWCLRFRLKPAILLLLIMNATILAGQYTKSYIKEQIQEPRPYVIWLEQHHGLDEKTFYELKRKQRGEMVTSLIADETQIPGWLKRHWAFETGFAFPSGHTMFAASWALLALGLLWPRRHYKTVVVIFLWATGVMASRLLLGMHWPRDLAMATILSWLLVTIATWLAQRFCGPLTLPPEEQKEVAQREP